MARTNTIQVLRASAWDTSENPGADTLKEGEFAWNNKGVLTGTSGAYTGVLWMGRKTNTNGTTENVQIYPPTFETLAHDTNATVFNSVASGNLTIGATATTVIIPGDLTVQGTTTSIATNDLEITDKAIELGKGTTTQALCDGVGIFVSPVTSGDGAEFLISTSGTLWESDINIKAPAFVGALTGNADTATTAAGVTTNANLTGDVTSVGNTTAIGTGVIVNADVKSDAAIAYSKLGTIPTWNQNTTGTAATVTTNANLTGDVTSTGNATAIAAGVIVNADVKSDAAIAYSKLGTIPTWNQNTTGSAATVTTNANLTGDITSVGNATAIATGVIVNADVKSDAAIAYSKLGTIPTWNQNTTGTAATVTTNANLTGDVTSVGNATVIAAGVIVNADVKSDAAIAYSKLGTAPTWNQDTTGNAATVTNGVYLTATQTITNKTIDCGTF